MSENLEELAATAVKRAIALGASDAECTASEAGSKAVGLRVLIGNGPESLQHVSMVGNDLKLDEGVGVCGKEGQSVPVGVGIPTIKIDRMTVGGTA